MGKRYRTAQKSYDKSTVYSANDAVEIVKKNATARFDETIEVAIKVKIKKGQSFRDTMVLPHTFAEEKKILVFARGQKAEEAEKAGATYVGDAEYVEKIKSGWLDFDVVIATPDMMKDIGRLGPILGRRGLMPTPKTRTVTMDVTNTIKELKAGRVEMRADKTGVIHISVGKASMETSKIAENVDALIREVHAKKPSEVKGDFLESAYAASTMGPSARLSV